MKHLLRRILWLNIMILPPVAVGIVGGYVSFSQGLFLPGWIIVFLAVESSLVNINLLICEIQLDQLKPPSRTL